jgi:hypothetical protein
MVRVLTIVFLGGVLLAFSAQAAQVPRFESEIPVYPGAVRDSEAEAEAVAEEERYLSEDDTQYQDWGEDPLIPRSTSLRIYTVPAPAEEILRYYLRELGGMEENGSRHLHTGATAPGTVSPVYYQIIFIDLSMYEKKEAKRAKAALAKARKPFSPGNWIAGAGFAWEVGEKNADITNFDLELRDDFFFTFDEEGNGKVQTSIIFRKTTYMNPADARKTQQQWLDEEESRAELQHAETVSKLAGAAFNPEKIGVPVYPGARYDTATTQFLRESMAVNGVAYRSTDKALMVAEFYGKQSGLRLIHADEEGALLRRCEEEYNEFLKIMLSTDCNVEITIQNPWLNMKTGKLMKDTLISIVNQAE